MQVTVTAKIQVAVSPDQRQLLDDTLETYRKACNFVAYYTSQACPVCGHIERSNRNKKSHIFKCRCCGYTSNDDRIGAMNLYCMGISYLTDSQVPDTVASQHI